MEYAIVGGGNMGRAIAAALAEKQVCPPEKLLVIEPQPEARARLEPLGCVVSAEADERLGTAGVCVMAVKPQVAGEAMAAVRPHLRPGQVLLSIMAGVTLNVLRNGLGTDLLVRAMPNTPAQIGLGMNVYHPTAAVPGPGLERVEALLNACGETLRVDSEDAIDAATAISGSGPAYVFYVAEHWIRAAEGLGFSTAEATRLVQQTLLGATELWRSQETSAAALREAVTSKGGTTAAALDSFESGKVGEGLAKGMRQAYLRAKELSR